MHRQIQSLADSLARSNEVVTRARRAGMEVSEAIVKLADGQERLVKARVAVHNFREDAVALPVKEGLTIAAEAHRAGQEALAERDFRRVGLGVSLACILLTLAGLWLAIGWLESAALVGGRSRMMVRLSVSGIGVGGGLIQTAGGSAGGIGAPRTKRSGWAR